MTISFQLSNGMCMMYVLTEVPISIIITSKCLLSQHWFELFDSERTGSEIVTAQEWKPVGDHTHHRWRSPVELLFQKI